jgi:hypothetical protein
MARADGNVAVSVERFFQFALLGLVASGFLGIAGSGYLDRPTIILVAAGLALRGLAVAGVARLEISERTAAAATAAYAGFFLLDILALSHSLLASAVHLVFFLAVARTLTARTNRDYLYLAAIASVELLAAALLSIDFGFFLSLALFLLFAMAALTGAEIRRSMGRATATARGGLRRFHSRLAALSVSIALGILATAAGLFFILPRTAEAAFSRFARRAHVPGFADQVTLGQMGGIRNTSRAAMHIRIWSSQDPGPLKWRGAALGDFDGRRWSNPVRQGAYIRVENGHADLEDIDRGRGRRLNYHVDFDALDGEALFFAGLPEKVDLRSAYLVRSAEGNYTLSGRPPDRFHYDAYSLLDEPPEAPSWRYPPPVLPLKERERYLELPDRLDARIPALARAMAGAAGSDVERARAIETALGRGYRYWLKGPDRETADPLADFLFTRRQGYCEYFASAMAVLLRTLGIPARLATGFQSGEYNPITELWVVRASDAHSWVEAWMPGRGWSTFDPTPPDAEARRPGLLARASLYLDAAQIFWEEWVVGYDEGRQGTLADRMEQGALRAGSHWYDALAAVQSGWKTYSGAVTRTAAIRAAIVGAAVLWAWLLGPPLVRLLRLRRRVERVRRGQASVGDATLLYERMLRILKRRGFQKPAWFTPAEFANSLPPGPVGAAVGEFTVAYNAMRFGGQTGVAPRLSLLLDTLDHRP